MKGIVFTEFLEMVEAKHSADVVDELIESAELPSGGAYTSVGTYDHREMFELVSLLSERTGTAVATLLRNFGEYLLSRFVARYPQFFEGADGTFAFLEQLENNIHVEVRKLYPDAELPRFKASRQGIDRIVMTYQSNRCLADLAEGLMLGTIRHYGESIVLARADEPGRGGAEVRFTLTRRSRPLSSAVPAAR